MFGRIATALAVTALLLGCKNPVEPEVTQPEPQIQVWKVTLQPEWSASSPWGAVFAAVGVNAFSVFEAGVVEPGQGAITPIVQSVTLTLGSEDVLFVGYQVLLAVNPHEQWETSVALFPMRGTAGPVGLGEWFIRSAVYDANQVAISQAFWRAGAVESYGFQYQADDQFRLVEVYFTRTVRCRSEGQVLLVNPAGVQIRKVPSETFWYATPDLVVTCRQAVL